MEAEMLKVFLVDDDPIITKGLEVLIDWNEEGFEVVGMAENGKEALEFLQENQVDLIIADIQMPVMNGLELLEILRTEELSDAYFIILSANSDFTYAQQALRFSCMDYILKPVQRKELICILRKISKACQNTRLQKEKNKQMEKAYLSRNLLSLLFGKYDRINLDYVKNHIRLSGEMRYIQFELDNMGQITEMIEEEKRKQQRKLYEGCVDFLGENSRHCIFDPSRDEKGYEVGFIYCNYMAAEQGMEEQEYFECLNRFVKKVMKIPVVMLIGKKVEDISKISKSYGSVCVLGSFLGFHGKREIYYYEKEAQVNRTGIVLCMKSLEALLRAVEQNNKTEIIQWVENFFDEMKQMGMEGESVKLNVNYLLFRLIHLAVEQDNDINQEEIFRFISDNTSEDGIMRGGKEHLGKFACEYGEYLTQLRKKASRGILQEIEKEIKENYAENLTLRELSKKYYINSAYLGQIFKKKYGQSFKDYLNNYRMEQAAARLIRTDDKIYQIAEEVGYKDLDYFISRFVAAKGCSPIKFRNQSREKAEE